MAFKDVSKTALGNRVALNITVKNPKISDPLQQVLYHKTIWFA